MKYLLISGSPRKGNIEFVLEKIFGALDGEKEFILLRGKNIKHCLGCLSCDETKKCVIEDDMRHISEKMKSSDVLILGSPIYYYNVSGIMKDFMDRTNPFYETGFLKGKKVILIMVGGSTKKSEEAMQTFKNFVEAHEMEIAGSFILEALHKDELSKNADAQKTIEEIIKKASVLKT